MPVVRLPGAANKPLNEQPDSMTVRLPGAVNERQPKAHAVRD